jgi:hypothetical protein
MRSSCGFAEFKLIFFVLAMLALDNTQRRLDVSVAQDTVCFKDVELA